MKGWSLTDEGWLARNPSVEAINVAKLQRFARDSHHPNLFEQAEGNDRWVGDLAGLGFENWLRTARLEFRHNGGVDGLPDFFLGGLGVGLKCRTSGVRFRPHFVVNVPDEHMRRIGEDIFFFAAYEESSNRLLLLGCMAKTRFQSEAVRTIAGTGIHPGLTAAAGTCWSVEAKDLAPPADFLTYMQTRIAA